MDNSQDGLKVNDESVNGVGDSNQDVRIEFLNDIPTANSRTPTGIARTPSSPFVDQPWRMRHQTNEDISKARSTYTKNRYNPSENAFPPTEPKVKSGAKLKKKSKYKSVTRLTSDRKLWLFIVYFFTWYIPEFLLKLRGLRSPEVILAWKEKYALCSIIALLSLVTILWLEFATVVVCPEIPGITFEQVSGSNNLVIVHGRVYDVGKSYNQISKFLKPFVGMDVSSLFPKIYMLARNSTSSDYKDPVINACVKNREAADRWSQQYILLGGADMQVKNGKLIGCSKPNAPNEKERCLYSFQQRKQLNELFAGDLMHYRQLIEKLPNDFSKPDYLVFNNVVFDVTDYLKLTILRSGDDFEQELSYSVIESTSFLPVNLTDLILRHVGGDATEELMGWPPAQTYIPCLERLFYGGVTRAREPTWLCKFGNPIMVFTAAIFYFAMIVKFVGSLKGFCNTRRVEYIDRYVIAFVPCYSENADSVRSTIDSLALTDYQDDAKLMFIVCDGMVTGQGNKKTTPQYALEVVGWKGKEPEALPYEALGDGESRTNWAKVYTGFYEKQFKRVPYVIVVKCGNEKETGAKAGNRGKRDSQIILMRFLNKLLSPTKNLNNLEFALWLSISNLTGVNPRDYEFVLMVDADTVVENASIDEYVAHFVADPDKIGLCGESRVLNKTESWVSMIQVHEYYISHHLGKQFESIFGSVTCLPGCFSMYRIKYDDITPVLADDDLIEAYSVNKVDTLHLKNLLHLGEDRYLTLLLLKTFPKKKLQFIPSAICWTNIPGSFKILLSQRRRWINSTFHNLWELSKIKNLCGFSNVFSMRSLALLDLLSTIILPISTIYLYSIIYRAVFQGVVSYGVVLIGASSLYLTHAIIFLGYGKTEYVFWMIFYLTLGLPVFSIILPLYAFWHFDDFGWGTTKKVIDEATPKNGPISVAKKLELLTLSGWMDRLPASENSSLLHENVERDQLTPMSAPSARRLNVSSSKDISFHTNK